MSGPNQEYSWLDRIIRFCLENKLIVVLALIFIVLWGVMVAPFDWQIDWLPRNPVPTDAIPDIGENQQIVFTDWKGRSPQDVEDQITYPLTVALLGIPGVKDIRSYSMFGFSTIYIIFKEDVEFYWSRSRVLERLNSLPAGSLPPDVQPQLGPDATALGQVFWYTLEGQDEDGNPTGGWDLQELRSIQDWYVRYALMSADGVSEVASVGGYVQEYQVDVDPDAMRTADVKLEEVVSAVRMSNLDVGASSMEINRVEYLIRGVGFVKSVKDIENAVIKTHNNVPIYVKNVARVTLGPAERRGALDKGGAEVVGGVVVVRYGENPLRVIKNVKSKIAEISAGLPRKTLADGTVSQVRIVPFYDRTQLIYETLGTLNKALYQEILVTIIVIILMLMHLRSSILISGLLPLAVLMTFIAMKQFGVDANVVALSGIAIAIGTMVDMGIVMIENILRHLKQADSGESSLEVVFRASSEVGSAVLTAVSTTVVSFLPVFTMEAAEGKLFKPLAFTKTFALIASVIVAITIIPPFAHWLFTSKWKWDKWNFWLKIAGFVGGVLASIFINFWLGLVVAAISAYHLWGKRSRITARFSSTLVMNGAALVLMVVLLATDWLPLGPEKGDLRNILFVGLLITLFMFVFRLFQKYYEPILRWALEHKARFLSIPLFLVVFGFMVWLGFDAFFGWLPGFVRQSGLVSSVAHKFPGLGKEFMPSLDEGAYLFMPTTMPHAGIEEALDVLQKQDMAINAIPEVSVAVGKIGRVKSPLDPAPLSMIETVINYHPHYIQDKSGKMLTFKFKPDSVDYFRSRNGEPLPAPDGQPYLVKGAFLRDKSGKLIPDASGRPFSLWRLPLDTTLNKNREPWEGIQSPQDIWDEIVQVAKIPGTTSAPVLQPIAARIVMLQSGMRAPMGIKVKGPSLEAIEKTGLALERLLKQVPAIDPATVVADRIVGKPYLEIVVDREAIARYGIMLNKVQETLEVAIGGKMISSTVEGRERYPIRIRYPRELRNNFEEIGKILVPAPDGTQIPLNQLAKLQYVRGPQVIKSEDTFLVGYVIFDKQPGFAEVDVVEMADRFIRGKIADGELELPAGVSYTFAGSYENQIRAQKRLSVILPLALFIIFLLLYFQFRSVSTTLLVFSGIAVAWAGGFIMLWLYGQSWFLDFSILGVNLRELFQIRPFNLSVAVWVGFLALFGIATDDGVLIGTYLIQSFRKLQPTSIKEIREATLDAGKKRVRPAVMTTATTVLALIPVLTATGRGADIMVPMAIPSFGGMVIAMVTMLVVPVAYAYLEERKFNRISFEGNKKVGKL
ncbi:MAG: efflux RND transporter permease subunit [Calditrichia bacterium]